VKFYKVIAQIDEMVVLELLTVHLLIRFVGVAVTLWQHT
jgi:hypothetical protein